MQYAADVTRAFIRAARTRLDRAAAFNLRGGTPHTRDVVRGQTGPSEIESQITSVENPLLFPPDLDDSSLVATPGSLPQTSLGDGIRETVETFAPLVAQGRMGSGDLD